VSDIIGFGTSTIGLDRFACDLVVNCPQGYRQIADRHLAFFSSDIPKCYMPTDNFYSNDNADYGEYNPVFSESNAIIAYFQ